MNENEQPAEPITDFGRSTLTAFRYDTFLARFSAAAPANSLTAVTLDDQNYRVFDLGVSEASDGTDGFPTGFLPDFTLRNLYKDGSFDKDVPFRWEGVGFSFRGAPFILNTSLSSGKLVTSGTGLLPIATYAETLAQLLLSQTYVRLALDDEEDCGSILGPIEYWGMGGFGLGDNSASPRLFNSIMGNHRLFAYATVQPGQTKSQANRAIEIKRSEKLALAASVATMPGQGSSAISVAQMITVTAFGRPDPSIRI